MSRILLAYDGSDPAKRAIEHVADSFPDADVTVLHVVGQPHESRYDQVGMKPAIGTDTEELLDEAHEQAAELLDEAAEIASDGGLDVRREIVEGYPAREIIEYAEENEFDHVVMGSHGRTGASRILLGSVAEKVTRRSPTPVTIVR